MLLLCLLMSCDSKEGAYESGKGAGNSTFTFLGLGADTPLNDARRDRLKERLGSEAMVRRTTIDLEVNRPGFLADHFGDLADLNKQLNWPPRERVEHAATLLTYRYIDAAELPFDKVALIFADPTGRPLLLNAYAGAAGEALLPSLEEKYGVAREIPWEGGHTRVWTQGEDRLLFTAWRDQYDRPRHTITIYYTANLKALMAIEGDGGKEKPSEGRKSIF